MASKTLAHHHRCRDLRGPRKERRKAPLGSDVVKARALEGAVRSFQRRLGKLGVQVPGPPIGAHPLAGSTSGSESCSSEVCVDCGPAFKSEEFVALPQET